MNALPKFSNLDTKTIKPALEEKLDADRKFIDGLLQQKNYSWENLIQPLEDMDVQLSNYWSVISHMNSVVNTDDLRKAYDSCLPLLTEYATEMGLNKDLYQAYETIAHSDEFDKLNKIQQKVITNALRDFKLAGVALEGEDKKQYQAIQLKLSELTNKYEQNVMDSTDAWSKLVTDESILNGIPDLAKQGFKQNAEQKGQDGWLIKLDFPSYYAVITYADENELRKEIYTAYCTRASNKGPHDKKFDNTTLMFEILKLRDEESKLLKFKHFGEYSLATKMAKESKTVLSFLNELAEKTRPLAIEEWKTLKTFAEKQLDITDFSAWDVAYASEKLKLHEHNFSQEELRPYFEVNHVIEGLFQVVQKLYGVNIVQNTDKIDTWHQDVTYYEVFDQDKQKIAAFYLDLYARSKKRGGAWMDECRTRHKNSKQELQLPIAYLTCNFTAPLKNKPSLLTHDEVVTLFHEFGHGLHHMLTKVDFAGVAGINGVAWDAVEFPSQFMENWCWHKASLNLIACHYQTKEPMPETLFNKLIASKNFQTGMQMLRQIEFALFDFRIHKEFDGEDKIQEILNDVRRKIAVVPSPSFNRFQHSFSHIFAGAYAAGYYSYKWAEVLASDAFSLFEKTNIFDPVLGQRFRQCILEKGGSEEPLDLFVQFQGREPSVDALLKESGII
jgi:oligopeptidase A